MLSIIGLGFPVTEEDIVEVANERFQNAPKSNILVREWMRDKKGIRVLKLWIDEKGAGG